MSEKNRFRSGTAGSRENPEFGDAELEATLDEFLTGEQKNTGKGILNFATVSGFVLLFVALTYVLHSLGLPIGGFLEKLAEGAVDGIPVIGGIFVLLVSFGYLVGDKKRIRKEKKKQRRKEKYKPVRAFETTAEPDLANDLEEEAAKTSRTKTIRRTGSYAAVEGKKLTKSVTDKKIFGVCGGLAEFLGISSTVVRLIFFVIFFTYGAGIPLYIALAMVMPKETDK